MAPIKERSFNSSSPRARRIPGSGRPREVLACAADTAGVGVDKADITEVALPTADNEQALAGVRVLDLTGGVAGAVAGMLLADLGADVVKVHPPGPGALAGQRGRAMWDRGKRAVSADPASPDDLRAVDALIDG